MALDYSSTNLIAMVRDICFAGSSQRDWDDTRLVRLINREVGEYMVPLIMRARKNHFVTSQDIPLVLGQKLYRLPTKATGLKLRAVQLVDANGNGYQPLAEAELEQAMNFGQSFLVGNAPQGIPQVYYFVGNQLALHPIPGSVPTGISLRLWYVSRPNTLVLVNDPTTKNPNVLQVTSLPGGAPQGSFRLGYTASAQPSWLSVNSSMDLCQNKPGFDVLGTFTISAVTSTTVDLTGTQPSDLLLNDWICPQDTAPVITGAIPEIVLGCLIKKVALEVTAAKGDQEAFGRLAGLLKLDEDKAIQFLNRRSTGDHRKTGILGAMRFKRGALGYPY